MILRRRTPLAGFHLIITCTTPQESATVTQSKVYSKYRLGSTVKNWSQIMRVDEFIAEPCNAVLSDGSQDKEVSFRYRDFLRTRAKVTFLLDAGVIFLVGIVAAFLRWGSPARDSLGLSQGFNQMYLIFLIPAVWFIALAWENAWIFSGTWSPMVVYGHVLRSGVITLFSVAGISFTFKADFSRIYVLIAISMGTTLLLIQRKLIQKHFERKCLKDGIIKKYLVVACCPPSILVEKIEKDFPDSSYYGVQLENGAQLPVDFLKDYIATRDIDAVVLCRELATDSLQTTQLIYLLDQLDCEIYLAEAIPILTRRGSQLLQKEEAYGVLPEPRIQHSQAQFKRVFDVFIASTVLLIISPLMIVVAILTKVTSRGPILFIQPRVGLKGIAFNVLKFRSMHQGASLLEEEIWKQARENGMGNNKSINDPRVTRFGKFIRRTSIDELPQLFNVLGGSMSIVGPRPVQYSEFNQMEMEVQYRQIAKPGITGLWQVSGRSDTSWEERMALDLEYVHNWSPITDLLLILRTVRVVVTGKGAH